MKIIRKIALTELQTLFYSPIAWLILIVFAFQCSMAFTDVLASFVRSQEMNYSTGNLSLQLFGSYRGLFTTVQEYLYLYIPLLTMSLMSRELSSGSINLLYSSPVTNRQIIFGKYLSMMLYGLVLIAILFVFVIWAAFSVENFDFKLALSGLLGLYLLICTYSAIGLFMSSLTSYQVVAAIGTLAVLAVLNFIGRFWQEYDFVRELTFWLSIGGRSGESINGLICSEDVLYFVIVSGLFLSLSILRLKSVRQKSGWAVSTAKYVGLFALVLTLGYLSSRPQLMGFYDATRTKQRTLTENSQKIIRQVKGRLTMTTYVNALDNNLYAGLPNNRKWDLQNFSQYVRFKPDMKMKYVYYYTNSGDPALARRYPDMTDSEIIGKISKASNIDSTMFMPPEEINKIIDLSSEGYRLTRLLELESGEKIFLRMFDDLQRYPNESEISAAFKQLAMKLPVIGFLTGHGERDYNNSGDRGYFRFSQDKPFRYSLINQGLESKEILLDKDVPTDINILVIADMRTPLTPEEQIHLDHYIARGGNLLIAGETRRQDAMNPLIAPLGVQFLPGQLVKQAGGGTVEKKEEENVVAYRIPEGALFFPNQPRIDQDFQADFIVSHPTEAGGSLSYMFEQMRTREFVATMPGCVGLEYTTDKGFHVTPLFVSDTLDCWNELETTNFVDDTVRLNPSAGEVAKSYPTALGLSRQIAGKNQKIIILGDADCISNAEISIQRSKVTAANYNMIMGSFFWLSDNEAPIDVRRPTPPDNILSATGTGVKISKWLLMGLFPLLILASYLVIWIRRRGR